MRHGILSCVTIVLLSANTLPAVLLAQPQPQLPPPPTLPPLETPRSKWTEPLWLRGVRWLCTDGLWSIYAAAGAVGCSAVLGSRRQSRSAKPLVLIVGSLIVCAGFGLFFFGLRSEEAALLPLGAILVTLFGLIVVVLGVPRPSQGGGG
jgi:hypothetical protein